MRGQGAAEDDIIELHNLPQVPFRIFEYVFRCNFGTRSEQNQGARMALRRLLDKGQIYM